MRKRAKIVKHSCEDCGKSIVPYEKGYKKCRTCFFKSKRCEDCGRQIVPYQEGYVKCKSCFYKSQNKLRGYTIQHLANIEEHIKKPICPQEKFHPEPKVQRQYSENNFWKLFKSLLFILFILMTISAFVSPIILGNLYPNASQDANFVFGNPRPIYFYDIEPSCKNYETNIVYSLNSLSQETEVKFIRVPTPIALLVGGISYDCEGIMTNPGAIGEAESGSMIFYFFIFSWNKVRLIYSDQSTITHETLHTMGFGHNTADPNSIMYPVNYGQSVEPELSSFIREKYTNNFWPFLNVIPLNLLYLFVFLILAIVSVISIVWMIIEGIFGGIFKIVKGIIKLFSR